MWVAHFFCKNISIYAIFNDQSFNDTLTNDIVSFEQLSPGVVPLAFIWRHFFAWSELFDTFNIPLLYVLKEIITFKY